MPEAFMHAIDLVFADPDLAADATWQRAEGEPRPIRIIARRADDVTAIEEGRLSSEMTRLELRVAEVPNPPRRPYRDRRRGNPHPG